MSIKSVKIERLGDVENVIIEFSDGNATVLQEISDLHKDAGADQAVIDELSDLVDSAVDIIDHLLRCYDSDNGVKVGETDEASRLAKEFIVKIKRMRKEASHE